MTLETLRGFFLWCAIINYCVLLLWVVLFFFARSWRQLQRRWFKISDETFAALHFGGMGLFKLGIVLFNLVPYIALRIVG